MLGITDDWVAKTITSTTLGAIKTKDIDFEESYPFKMSDNKDSDSIDTVPVQIQKKIFNGKLENINNLCSDIYDMFNKYCEQWIMFREGGELVSRLILKGLNMNLINDGGFLVYSQSDGRLMQEAQYRNMDNEKDNLYELHRFLKTQDIDFGYVMIPSPVTEEEEEQNNREGYKISDNKMANEVIAFMEEKDISYLDLRQKMKDEEISWKEAFYITDHHWKPETGFWAAKCMSNYINEILGGVENNSYIWDKNNWEIETIPKAMLGSYGRKATEIYCEKEALDLWYPKFPTSINKIVSGKSLDLSGTFEDVIYNRTIEPCYDTWNHGLNALRQYRNYNEDAINKKVLLLTESYSFVVTPFISLEYENVDEIDLRIFNGSLETYIEETRPDIVLVVYSPNSYNPDAGLFDFK